MNIIELHREFSKRFPYVPPARWFTQRVGKVILQEGIYEMRIAHVRVGMNLAAIEFTEE